jgi:23S rRNA pseudouridine1911/1915/1917 synthase
MTGRPPSDSGDDAPGAPPAAVTRFQARAAGRVDLLVAAHLAGKSRRRVAALFAAGRVSVDGRVARKGQHVPAGATIEIAGQIASMPAGMPAGDAELAPLPELALSVLPILHLDAALVVVNKPPGMPSHPLRPGERGTAANALVTRWPECAGVGQDPREAGLVHRLDTGTSGVLAAARTQPAWVAVRSAFARGAVHKRYLALVHGTPSGAGCELPLVHRGKRMAAARHGDAGALPAVTRWQVRERLGAFSLVECTAHTGRMHQVRAHLALAGAPIVGDRTYGPDTALVPGDLPLCGHFLHALAITLPHPLTGALLTIEAPLPPDRRDTLDRLRTPGPGVGDHG